MDRGKPSGDRSSDLSIVDESAVPTGNASRGVRALRELRDSAASNWQHRVKHIFCFIVIGALGLFSMVLLLFRFGERFETFAITILSSIAGGAIAYLFQERSGLSNKR